MSDEFDISNSMAAELTGSLGVPDDATTDDVLPSNLADAVEEQERHLAERDVPVNNDVDDTREAAEQREAEQAQKRGRGQKVPLAALHEERQKRQALELQLQAQSQQMQQWQAQLQAQQQAVQQAKQEAAIPDFDEDPRGYIEAKERQFAQALAQVQNGPAQQQAQTQQLEAQVIQEFTALAPTVVEAEQRILQQHPDYGDAFAHVQAIVDAQLRSAYPNATAEELQLGHKLALLGHVKRCQANGIDPCEAVYNSAQGLGYKPVSRTPRREPPTSLANAHGSTRAPDERSNVSASDISNMSEAEFDKFFNDMKRGATVGPAF